MTGDPVLIAAYSGRALAASARRAGYAPLVVDAFGDTDTRALAVGYRHLGASNLQPHMLRGAFSDLTEAHGDAIGLVLGAGFESEPGLIAHLAEFDKIFGCTAETVQRCSDPQAFFSLLDHHGIPHPETRLDPPAIGSGWLTKRAGASGGGHIARCKPSPRALPGRYFQREIEGEPVSGLAITSPKGTAFAFSRQWSNPTPRRPFRYGGAVGNIIIDAELEANLVDIMLALCETLQLNGLVSFDFVVRDDEPFLLEVNPRPGATLDILDDDAGTLFKAHVAAATGGDPIAELQAGWAPRTRAAAYLYADRGKLTVPDVSWPEWTADRPAAGSKVRAHAPLATVLAEAATPEAAEALCGQRLAALEQMLYQTQKSEDASP